MKIKTKDNFMALIKSKGFNLIKLSQHENVTISLQALRMISSQRIGIKYYNAIVICEITGYEFDELFELKP